MIAYLIKLILCSALFFLAYKGLFEREKMLRFNRFYLLCSLLCSFAVPLVTIHAAPRILPVTDTSLEDGALIIMSNAANATAVHEKREWLFILVAAYVAVTTLLLARFVINLIRLLSVVYNNPVVPYGKAKLVLVEAPLVPHSFLRFIFIRAEDYRNGKVEHEVLCHELAHVGQKHSLDVIFIELVQAMAWFNPVFICYRRSLQLNHEFLADDCVVSRCGNTRRYQQLLIDKSSPKTSSVFASSFNYSITKKRLVMMTTSTSPAKALCKQMLVAPLFGAAMFMFSIKTVAQDPGNTGNPRQREVQPAAEGVSPTLLNEYEAIVNKNQLMVANTPPRDVALSPGDRNRLETIFFSMSKEQQAKQAVRFSRPPSPAPRIKPTQQEYTMIKNPRKYAITIDGKRMDNTELNKYKPDDFWGFAIIYLAKTNRNYGKHLPLDVYLMTEEYYKQYVKMGLENKNNIMIVQVSTKPQE